MPVQALGSGCGKRVLIMWRPRGEYVVVFLKE